jgi:hypothetical protein
METPLIVDPVAKVPMVWTVPANALLVTVLLSDFT